VGPVARMGKMREAYIRQVGKTLSEVK